MVDRALISQAKRLSTAERLDLIGELWQNLNVDDLPVTDAERAMVDERRAELTANPDSGRQWDDVEADLRRRLP